MKNLFSKKLISRNFAEKALETIRSNRLVVKFASFCLVGLFSIAVTVVSVGITVGFDVNYSGKVIATVSDSSVFANAKNIAVKSISSDNADKAITEPKFVMTLTVADKLCNPEKLAAAIIKNTDNISEGSALVVNGETLICTEPDTLSDMIDARRTAFCVDGAENTASFVDSVEIKKGYYLSKDIKEISEAEKIVNSLNVKTVSTTVSNNTIPFSTKKIKTSSYEYGYHKVHKKGVNGVKQTTFVKVTVNGVENSESQVSSVIITEPTEQVEIIGTAYAKLTATERASAASNGFILPLNSGVFKISSYFGDGRNHKGIDLCAPKGTAIFAVSSGTVVSARYDGDYGYNVVIDHGNGIKTRYAHASALCVSAGAKVSQGDMIAAVGSTGYSTGNHLHFEVIVNGTRVNPAPYIGL